MAEGKCKCNRCELRREREEAIERLTNPVGSAIAKILEDLSSGKVPSDS